MSSSLQGDEFKMHEKAKLIEAEYFLNEMVKNQSDYYKFTFNLSAFLAASRSVLYYMLEELKGTSNQAWLDKKTESSDVLKFFRHTRDLNIHVQPLRPAKDVTVMVSPFTAIATTLGGVAISSNGSIVYSSSVNEFSSEIPKIEAEDGYRFDEAFFDQNSVRYDEAERKLCKRLLKKYDVLSFCKKYLSELEALVSECVELKYIRG
jgi:hypothetical protein